MSPKAQMVRTNLHYEKQEDGTIVAWVPDLPGCVTDGDTLGEAKARAVEAITLYLEDLIACGEPIPDGIRMSKPFGISEPLAESVAEIEFPLAVNE